MKPSTQTILNILKDETLFADLSNLLTSHAQHVHNDVTYKEAYDSLLAIKVVLLDEIEKNRFDSINFSSRNTIHSHLQQIQQHRNNPTQIINLVDAIQSQINSSGILLNRLGKADYSAELKELGKLKKSLGVLLNNFDAIQTQLNFINKKEIELNQLIENIQTSKTEVEANKTSAEDNLEEINTTLESANQKLEAIKESQKTIEETKLGITTFHQNIEEYKKQIIDIETKASEVVAKDKTISKLIDDAREALKLGSATGISAAFSAQYELANDQKKYIWWVRGAIIALLLAAGFTTWAIGGWGIKNPDSISSILARVVGVTVTVAAAAFCARQYVNQKTIAEDYAYKAVLSKSIVAFTEELAVSTDGNSDENIKHYLMKVLDEIHKDPLRPRRESSGRGFSKMDMEKLNNLAEFINKVKG